MQIENLQTILLIGFGLVCVLPVVIAALATFFLLRAGRRWLDGTLNPDIARLTTQYATMHQRQPNISDERLLGRIIHQQAVRCGVVGAITGLGGFYTLPIALPVDIVLSTRIQSGMVGFIAQHYTRAGSPSALEEQVRTYIIMTGSARAAEHATGMMLRFALRIIGTSFSKLIPIIGALISFAVNYAIARAIGWSAVHWYRRNTV